MLKVKNPFSMMVDTANVNTGKHPHPGSLFWIANIQRHNLSTVLSYSGLGIFGLLSGSFDSKLTKSKHSTEFFSLESQM